ncbi:(d)CMP kinase [Clostridium minihomine]|uniref:(d)CMP kinase n=1 Tax=Clostridium minihomine TaxID=2045012 RepID=UPI000C77E239|nr:(d)CMP kinase [Clostridium minihomine]
MNAIAIDGPAGAGKSTIARCVAHQLGYLYVDTGALYRAIGLYVLRLGKDPGRAEDVIPLLKEIRISLQHREDGDQRVLLGDEDVSEALRTAEVSAASSRVSAIPEVREFLLSLQRGLADRHNVVMDGRDIGTVVLPQAQLKIFLTASLEERAKRRWKEMCQKGLSADLAAVTEEVRRRDEQDSTRKISPLVPAADSILVDTTGNTLEQSVEQLLEVIRTRLS